MLEKILSLAKAKGFTQDAFEAAVPLAQGRISKWKGGKGRPNVKQTLDMARVLGISPYDLIDEGTAGASSAPASPPSRKEPRMKLVRCGLEAFDFDRIVRLAIIMGHDDQARQVTIHLDAGDPIKLYNLEAEAFRRFVERNSITLEDLIPAATAPVEKPLSAGSVTETPGDIKR